MPENNVKDKLVTLEALKLVNDIKLPKDISELDSVPTEVNVSPTDIIAMQVDGSTYKLPVSALASALKTTGNYITSSEVANDLTTSTAGKVLDARQGAAIKSLIDSLDLPDVSEANENVSWKSAPIGISHYYYDEVNASTIYGVPVDNCFVVVMRSDGNGSQSRGVALAFRWTRGSSATTSSNDVWISTLHDDSSVSGVNWFAWIQISFDILPIEKGGTGSDNISGIRSNIGAISKSGDTMTGNLSIVGPFVHLQKKSPEMDMMVNPSTDLYNYGLYMVDKESRPVGQIDTVQVTTGDTALRLIIYDYDTSGNITSMDGIYIYGSRSGGISYHVSNPENFRYAIGLGRSSGPLPVEYGGTGVNSISNQKIALGLGAQVYPVRGAIVKSGSSGTTVGHGVAIITVVGNLVAVDFEATITTAGSVERCYDVGIQFRTLKAINSTIPDFRIFSSGIIHYYNPDGTINSTMEGYGGEAVIDTPGNQWCFARMYTLQGDVGSWTDGMFSAGLRIVGRVYGTL